MKKPPTPSAGGLLNHEEGNNSEPFPERHDAQGSFEDALQPYFEGSLTMTHDAEPSEIRDLYCDQHGTAANDFLDYRIPNFGIDPEGTFPRDLPDTSALPTLADRNDYPVVRGIENYAEVSRQDFLHLESGRRHDQLPVGFDCQYNTQPNTNSFQSEMVTVMQSAPYPSTSNAPQTVVQTSHYASFRGMFDGSESARYFRKDATRFDRKPYRTPDDDLSIKDIENERQRHVMRIYNAMIRADTAKDNRNSIAMKRWVHDAYYDSKLVEAYAHKILDCLLAQAKDGFRGWNHNDYAQDDRKGEAEDKEASCADRLDNIIRALEEEKTICEDVMNSACQIRMFVNAPRAYAYRKLANRVGNSKRGRPKDSTPKPDEGTRSAKSRKPNVKREKRARQSTPGAARPRDCRYVSQTPDPPPEEQQLQSQYKPPPIELASSLISSFLDPISTLIPSHAEGHVPTKAVPLGYHVQSMSPSQPHTPHIPRVTHLLPQHESSFMSPPPPSHGSESVTPEQPHSFSALFDFSWPQPDSIGPNSYPAIVDAQPVEGSLFAHNWDWSKRHEPGEFQFGQALNDGPVSPSTGSPMKMNEANNFQEIWSSFHGVQQFPNRSLPERDPTLRQL